MKFFFLIFLLSSIISCFNDDSTPTTTSKRARPNPKVKVYVIAGTFHTCAILDDRSVKCYGQNNLGQLGLGDTDDRGDESDEMGVNLPIVNLGTGRKVKMIDIGNFHTCAILDNDLVKCWGGNNRASFSKGYLGLGHSNHRGDDSDEMGNRLPTVDLGIERTAKMISVGNIHTCAILDDNSVKCWGWNEYGQLGLGDTSQRGDSANQMGDHLPTVDLGTERTAKFISAGVSHTCAILDDDSLKCWGSNVAGELGLGIPCPKSTLFVTPPDCNKGDEDNEMGDNLSTVDLGTERTAKTISAGTHTCAILDNDSVKCWGWNSDAAGRGGFLGLEDTNDRGDSSNEMGDNLLTVNLGTGRTAKAVSVGDGHTCVILDNNLVKCWGWNDSGQLGLGNTTPMGGSSNEMGSNLPTVNLGIGRTAKTISVGNSYSCVTLDNNSIKCWGRNEYGELGLGDTNERGDGPNEMSDKLPIVKL